MNAPVAGVIENERSADTERKPRRGHPSPFKGKKRDPEVAARMKAGRLAKHPVKPLAERYWAKVDKRGPDECWPWLGNKNPHGYGQVYPGPGLYPKKRAPNVFAHHVAMMLAGVWVPEGMVRDHTCKRRDCQNPAHIRIVTQAVNVTENSMSPHAINSRLTHCRKCSNPLSGDNLHIAQSKRKNGTYRPTRVCLTCYRARRPGTKL